MKEHIIRIGNGLLFWVAAMVVFAPGVAFAVCRGPVTLGVAALFYVILLSWVVGNIMEEEI
jgi:hypothetical protein